MHAPTMGLNKTDKNADIYTIGTTDSISAIIDDAEWRITKGASGYVFKPKNYGYIALRLADGTPGPGANIEVSEYTTSSTNYQWTLESYTATFSKVILYNAGTGNQLSNTTKYVAPGETLTLSQLGITPMFCSNFTISQAFGWSTSSQNVAAVSSDTGAITAIKVGTASIIASMRVNRIEYTNSYTLYVQDKYMYELTETFGFSQSDADLIYSVYDRVEISYPSDSYMEKAWRCARTLSSIPGYCGWKWDNVASKVADDTEIEDYFVNKLGFTTEEYNQLMSAVNAQHSDTSTLDFAHQQYSLAARLAYELDIDGFASNLGTLETDLTVSYLAGWLGDATLKVTNTNTTSFGNDDYCADLDAENIFRLIDAGQTSISAMNDYYSNLTSSSTRADVFLEYIDYSYVKEKVFSELGLDHSDSEDWERVHEDYPDTYNFLLSLENGLSNMGDY